MGTTRRVRATAPFPRSLYSQDVLPFSLLVSSLNRYSLAFEICGKTYTKTYTRTHIGIIVNKGRQHGAPKTKSKQVGGHACMGALGEGREGVGVGVRVGIG